MDDINSLLGSAAPSAQSTTPAGQAASQGVEDALKTPTDDPAQEELVKKLMGEYATARGFDKDARVQYNRDRKYAAGLADPNWVSDANLIGSFIDILVSFLYAQNPDPGVKPALQVGEQPQTVAHAFAETMELVIQRLWRDGNLKKNGKKWVRSGLTVGPGWVKGTMLTQKTPAPVIEKRLADAQDQMKSIGAYKSQIGPDNPDGLTIAAQEQELQTKIQGLQAQLLKKTRYGFLTDFVRAEDITVALNVADMADYKEADWIANDIYVPANTAKQRFPELTEAEIAKIEKYYQRNIKPMDDATESQMGDAAVSEGQFSKNQPNSMGGGEGKPLEFIKIVEFWDRRDFMIKTMVEGLPRWATLPYPPPQASTRFYPFFYIAFFPVEGKRHPQSLSWRLRKLQDEYSSCRSNQRLTRERSVTGIIFNATAIDPVDANKITDSNQQEMIPVRASANEPLQNLFIEKPVGTYNAQLFDTQPILADMERISGVQEALQQSAAQGGGQPKTATEAQIQQQGFASRTSADRDVLEDALTDLAQYTAEVSVQECPASWVTRVCGPSALWLGPDDVKGTPPMDVEDVLTMVNVTIDAGTTGKPNFAADKANWATILPLLEQSLGKIRAAQGSDPGMAQSLINVLKETLVRMDDRLDLDEFIPQGQPTPPPPEMPKMTVSVALQGTVTPEQEQMLLGAEAAKAGILPGPPGMPPGPPGMPPGPMHAAPGAPVPVPQAAHAGLQIPSHLPGTQIPMPQLEMKKPPAPSAGPPPK